MSPNLTLYRRELRSSLSGKDIPEDIKARMLKMHEDIVQLQEQLRTSQDKLTKARTVSPDYYTAMITF